MARRTKFASWLGMLAILTHPCGLMGTIEVLNPIEGQNLVHNSSIGCLGNTNLGQDVLVKLIVNNIEIDQATIDVPPQDNDWSKTWNDPEPNGWTVGDTNNKVEVWVGAVRHDHNTFKVIQGM